MSTVRELLRTASILTGDSPERDAQILLCHCLGKNRSWLYAWPEKEVDGEVRLQFEQLLARRCAGEPVAYLTGCREFWSLPLHVNQHTLIPRPETETLVEWALQLPLPANTAALDLGTGTGAIALALASERPAWRVSAVDASEQALAVARRNAIDCDLEGVSFARSDWYSALGDERFDLLACNPPYIEAGDAHLQQGDVRFEPRSALVAPQDGLGDIEQIIDGAPHHLNTGGWLLLEHGFEQGDAVRALLEDRGFCEVATRRDMAGQERISGGRWDVE